LIVFGKLQVVGKDRFGIAGAAFPSWAVQQDCRGKI